MNKTLIIMKKPGHMVEAEIAKVTGGFELVDVLPVEGEPPFWEDLQHSVFPDFLAIKTALLARMRAQELGAPQLALIDRILISPIMYRLWSDLAVRVAQELVQNGTVIADSIPDEEVEVLPNGDLKIFVSGLPGAEMTIGKAHWKFREQS